ncbi:MAG TPA: hypothetical protein VI028_12210 [Solirubrobacterales bacterium]
MEIERHRAPIRIALIYLTVTIGFLAIWILVAPRGFYDNFPGGSTHWVSALPPYNEHLERDFGAASLGLALLAGLAAYWMDRRVIQATALAMLAAGLPHLAYHLTTTGHYSTGDNVASLIGLALDVVLPLGLLYLVSDGAQRAPARPPKAGSL